MFITHIQSHSPTGKALHHYLGHLLSKVPSSHSLLLATSSLCVHLILPPSFSVGRLNVTFPQSSFFAHPPQKRIAKMSTEYFVSRVDGALGQWRSWCQLPPTPPPPPPSLPQSPPGNSAFPGLSILGVSYKTLSFPGIRLSNLALYRLNKNWHFSVLWPLLTFPNLLVYWVQHFYSITF